MCLGVPKLRNSSSINLIHLFSVFREHIRKMCSVSSSVRVDLKRCPCIHSLSQLVDVTLQSLLYQRQMIPEPASSLLLGSSQVAEQFKNAYHKVQKILRDTFRSVNGDGRIQEFVILVGGTPFSPKEIYRIRIPLCRRSDAKAGEEAVKDGTEINGGDDVDGGENDGRCCNGRDTICEELSAKERRLVFSAIALSKTAVAHFEGCNVPGKTDKVFLFIRTRGQLETNAEGLEEDDSFELPDEEMQRRRKIQQLRIQVNAPCTQRNMQNGSVEKGGRKVENDENERRMMHGSENGNHDYHPDEKEEEPDEDEEGADENAEPMTLWYRLGPFFTNLI